MKRSSFLVVLVPLSIALARDANAQPKADLTDAGSEVLKEAADAARKKDWAVCRTKAAGVWDKVKDPIVASLLGACEAELGLNREAAEHLDFYLQRDDGKHPVQTKVANDHFPGARAKVELVEIVPSEQGVDVQLDGSAASTRFFVDPGKHVVEVRKDGFAPKSVDLDATPGGSAKLDVKLDPLPATHFGVGPGTGFVGDPHKPPNSGDDRKESGSKAVWPYGVLGAVAAGGLGLGIGGVVASRNAVASAPLHCANQACVQRGDAALSKANTWQGVGATGFALAGGAGVGLLIYALLPAPKGTAPNVTPSVAPGSAGLSVDGRF